MSARKLTRRRLPRALAAGARAPSDVADRYAGKPPTKEASNAQHTRLRWRDLLSADGPVTVLSPDRDRPSVSLVPPSYHVVKPQGQTARVFPTVAQAATAIVGLGPTPATVSAMTGRRTRNLTGSELHELGELVRASRRRRAPDL